MINIYAKSRLSGYKMNKNNWLRDCSVGVFLENSVSRPGFLHPVLIGPANELAAPSSLVIFIKEDRLGMSLPSPTAAPGIAAFSLHPGD
jgi:hypothetical protein